MKKIIVMVPVLLFLIMGCKNSTDPKPDPLTLTFTISHVSQIDSSDGSIDISVAGGVQPYIFSWSNGSATEDISGLSMGIYTITVTDADNKVKKDSVEIGDGSIHGTITDVDGNIYQTIKIGDQWWMAENLKATHDARGNDITSYVYNNSSANEDIYGRLYTWNAVMNGLTTEASQGIAPDGWHIPTDVEWQTLFNYLGGVSIAGGKMKETGTIYWAAPNSNASNSSGFTSLPAGGGYRSGTYEGLGDGSHYWSSTDRTTEALAPTLHSGMDVLLNVIDKTHRISVRCIKD